MNSTGRLRLAVSTILTAALLGCSTTERHTAPPDRKPEATSTTTPITTTTTIAPLRQAAQDSNINIGAAVDAERLRSDDAYRQAVAANFTSVTPENAMKWTVARPTPEEWNWEDADEIVEFAEQEDLQVRGHTLVWGQDAGNGLPDWLRDIEDATEFRSAVETGIREQVGRYRGRVDRWDVVNEPLEYAGSQLNEDVYLQRLGPGYVGDAFRIAHEADPEAELWLNDFSTEIQPNKADALVLLVEQLVADGVPIDGVGIQTHLSVDVPIAEGAIAGPMERIGALGLKVAITELDIPTGPSRSAAQQTELYERVATECLRAGCVEITTWGVTDRFTWLDNEAQRSTSPFLQAWSLPSNPLLLDAQYQPKPAYAALVDALRTTS